LPRAVDPGIAHVGSFSAVGQHRREGPIQFGAEDHPLVLALEGEAPVEQFGAMLTPGATQSPLLTRPNPSRLEKTLKIQIARHRGTDRPRSRA
jgi:hypothetical protein